MQVIKITDYVSLNQGVTSEEGQPIYELILSSLKRKESVELDFSDVTFVTTAFLNVVIGTLYKDFTSEQLKDLLNLTNYSPDMALRIKKVTDNAKAYYANTEVFENNVDEILHDCR